MLRHLNLIKDGWKGIVICIITGAIAIAIKDITKLSTLDPLLVAMAIGIALRALIKFNDTFISGFRLAPSIFIPVGVILYGAVNLNFTGFAKVDATTLFLIFIVFICYLISTLILSGIFGLKEKTGYLIATGSAICGASAIAITSKAVDAEPSDVSMSLIPVYLSALLGLFFILPFIRQVAMMSDMTYGVFSGGILQFTGFVKAAVANYPVEIRSIALSVKATRYVGLLFVIPLFASFIKGRLYIPWYLGLFLGAGVLFSLMPDLSDAARPICKITLNILWSIAMAAIGLNTNIKTIISKDGIKAFCVSILSFLVAAGVFLGGIKLM